MHQVTGSTSISAVLGQAAWGLPQVWKAWRKSVYPRHHLGQAPPDLALVSVWCCLRRAWLASIVLDVYSRSRSDSILQSHTKFQITMVVLEASNHPRRLYRAVV